MAGLWNKLTALVIDGDYTCNTILQATLRSFGVEAYGAKDGRAALNILAMGFTFNLILIDLLLPVIDGIEITRLIRAIGVKSMIMAFTVSTFETDGEAFLEAGADMFIEKPMDNELLALILEDLDDAADGD